MTNRDARESRVDIDAQEAARQILANTPGVDPLTTLSDEQRRQLGSSGVLVAGHLSNPDSLVVRLTLYNGLKLSPAYMWQTVGGTAVRAIFQNDRSYVFGCTKPGHADQWEDWDVLDDDFPRPYYIGYVPNGLDREVLPSGNIAAVQRSLLASIPDRWVLLSLDDSRDDARDQTIYRITQNLAELRVILEHVTAAAGLGQKDAEALITAVDIRAHLFGQEQLQ